MKLKYSYKVFSKILLQSKRSKEVSLEIKISSYLVYNLEVDIKAIDEKFSIQGILTDERDKSYAIDDDDKNLQMDEITFMGYFF